MLSIEIPGPLALIIGVWLFSEALFRISRVVFFWQSSRRQREAIQLLTETRAAIKSASAGKEG